MRPAPYPDVTLSTGLAVKHESPWGRVNYYTSKRRMTWAEWTEYQRTVRDRGWEETVPSYPQPKETR